MSPTYVFVDVETTGFNPDRDQIIEVAAVAWRDGAVVDEFQSLVNPDRPLPFEITQLTGITDDMLVHAPRMSTVRTHLRRIIGDHPLVGHNVEFDLGFLRAERLGYGNHRLDTLTLASILWPDLGRYGLEHLVQTLALPHHETPNHRAMADVLHTLDLFQALHERALTIDFVLLEELVEAGDSLMWPETLFFREIMAERARRAATDPVKVGHRLARLYNPPRLEGRPVVPPDDDEEPDELDADVIGGMLRPGSNFSRAFPHFEYREQQEVMTRTVAEAFNQQAHLLVEAGTGTGKSLAYLLPAAFWSTHNRRRVVISTNTINLQDQLVQKDIPTLQAILPFELRAAVRKGRGNYVCTRLFQQMRHRGPKNGDEMAVYARLLLWLPQTESGDVAEISAHGLGQQLALRRLSAETGNCRTSECAAESCPLHVTRRRAELAHLVIVNHALLLSDVASQNHILPEFRDLIIDEAHHFELAVTNGLSFSADKRFLEAVLDDINKPKGLLGDMLRTLGMLPPQVSAEFENFVARMRDDGDVAAVRLDEFFEVLRFFLRDMLQRNSEFTQQVRLVPSLRRLPHWDDVELSWDNLSKLLARLAKGLGKLAQSVGDVAPEYGLENADELQATLAGNAGDLEETVANIDQIILKPNDGMIYWIEVWRDRLSLHAAPLHIGPLVEEHIFEKLDTVILTSATLRTAPLGRYDRANFDYVRRRLHAGHALEMAVGSPFNYQTSTLLYLCTDIPEPRQPGYQRYVEQAVIDTAATLEGRTLVLFTSYRQLRETAEAITAPLAERGIRVLAQFEGTSRQQLLEQFKLPDSRAVLLGTKSFWEGVDVPGPALEAVVLVKIPFDVPSDPIFAARSETFDNPFYDYSIPEAVLKFRQGFGRLIRRNDDEGIVVVLDKRVLSKRYGELFLNALPPCTMLRQRTDRLPEIIRRWQNRER